MDGYKTDSMDWIDSMGGQPSALLLPNCRGHQTPGQPSTTGITHPSENRRLTGRNGETPHGGIEWILSTHAHAHGNNDASHVVFPSRKASLQDDNHTWKEGTARPLCPGGLPKNRTGATPIDSPFSATTINPMQRTDLPATGTTRLLPTGATVRAIQWRVGAPPLSGVLPRFR